MKKAFSLIELLISLITISVIIASFAPVITQKLKYGKVAVTKGETITNKCDKFSPDCKLCTKKQCLICTKTCLSNQYLDRDNCNCVSCPNNCESCTELGCTRCKAGYQKKDGACEACQSGYYSSSGSVCQKCPKGSKANLNSAATACISCTGGEYQDLEGQISCKNCPGFVSDNNRKCTSCIAGTKWNGSTCENCPSGSFSNTANATNCTQCPKGSYQDETGKTSCKSCNGINQYQNALGQTKCLECWHNSKPNANHSWCENICVENCPEYQYYDGCLCHNCSQNCISCTDENNCNKCEEGYYLSVKDKKCRMNPCINDSVFIQNEYDQFCMKKYNAGDPKGPIINKNDIDIVEDQIFTTDYTSKKNPKPICISGVQTSSEFDCTSTSNLENGWDYETCYRAACNWWAANKICQNISWSLPNKQQLQSVNLYKNRNLGSEWLQLCARGRYRYNIPICSGDKTAASPYGVWGNMGTLHLHLESPNNSQIQHSSNFYNFYSVRCVLDLP